MKLPAEFLSKTGLLCSLLFAATVQAAQVELWKDPNCGCCLEWAKHMEQNGFEVKIHNSGNEEQRAALGITPKYGSCHTATVEGYALEGHVPAAEVKRLLREKPDALGLAVPAMPVGSPGMDNPYYQGRQDPYEVLLLQKDGSSSVYQSYPEKK
ncbi:hypothetical protein EDC45_1447 [Mesocricetibacter intestinalis]|uniref:Metal-binding protein n=1 Tax=Mesocricetibacter intestinalis TaxID=1521930 RepID=A0A4R6V7D5_9PAST|nr:DUF411 domain-containing protein [Mesocricetibacter intestinalis]TDQ57387.1 hypothetical protein EDC45_1447 [Mesocricetibacter intestinalis]